jgi:hypothetical protein
MVLVELDESNPVASFMRLAARPVGAQSMSPTPFAERMRRMALTRVVLPTPGPPAGRLRQVIGASMTMAVGGGRSLREPTRAATQFSIGQAYASQL